MSASESLQTEYGVVARASRPGPLPFVLKDAETFAIFSASGDIADTLESELGVFHEGMRHVSRLELLLWGRAPLLLSAGVREDNCLLTAHLTNPDLGENDEPSIEKGTVHVQRSTVLVVGGCSQRIRLTSFANKEIEVPLLMQFRADFHDIFEVRGHERLRRGKLRPVERIQSGLRFSYDGLDHVQRSVSFVLQPVDVHYDDFADEQALSTRIRLTPHETTEVFLAIVFVANSPSRRQGSDLDRFEVDVSFRANVTNGQDDPASVYAAARQSAIERYRSACADAASISTDNELFNDWVSRSFADIHLLATPTEHGRYPYAGVPWYSCPFGRDGLITAREMLTIEPNLTRGVLGFLAHTQAVSEDDAHDAQPGKIVHEMRLGEMAAIGEVPFARYYGTADATPLFIWLAGDYLKRTGDLRFIHSIWENIEAALRWIDDYGDEDGDGYVEYHRHSQDGLVNQGWKDSHDSIFHADGSDPVGPIALCEVQGYVYAAKRAAAEIARALNDRDTAKSLMEQADRLRLRFEKDFWCADLRTYALAIDGQKNPCCVVASNAGHALFSGIASEQRAAAVSKTLMGENSFSDWGIRTLDQSSARFNPMSYHNGSVWPHDNALIALGFAKYNLKAEVLRIMNGLFDTALFMPMHRLPELFCGFARQHGEGPTMYPVACLPQAWASGAVFALVEACLGLSVRYNSRGRPRVTLDHPVLPPFLGALEIRNLPIGDDSMDLMLHRHETDVSASVIRRPTGVEVIVRS